MLLILISDLHSEQDIQGYETSLHKQNSEIRVLFLYAIYRGILKNITLFPISVHRWKAPIVGLL